MVAQGDKESIRARAEASIKKMIRETTVNRLVQNGNLRSKVKIVEVEDQDAFVYAHWMSIILLSGKHCKLTFSTHFFSDDTRGLVAGGVRRSPDKITFNIQEDFFKEFCNAVAGGIKACLELAKIEIGLSLPLVTRGFDQVNFSDHFNDNSFRHVWEVDWGRGSVYCAYELETDEPECFFDLKSVGEISQKEGEIELL